MKKIVLTLTAVALVFTACTTPGKKTAIGAGAGAAIGAIGGAVIAHNTGGKAETGALIGAAAGGLLGGGIGNYYDKQAKELAKIATVERNADGSIKVVLKNDILFATGSSELSAAAKQNVADLGKVLKKYPENIIVVEGYTDSTGSEAFNLSLSQKRAQAVYNELLANNVKTYSIGYQGFGQSNPIASNATAEGRSQNRRVNLNITANQKLVEQNYK
ncbi:outer membrane protein OmpA-like peptidoglycan-associated protein [Elusimicrobium simillimum]|uniref:OmpA family protein n=1 Tax=Elusimicrobium simillimum TaxID=3143438 RepID=UPI003C6FE11A